MHLNCVGKEALTAETASDDGQVVVGKGKFRVLKKECVYFSVSGRTRKTRQQTQATPICGMHNSYIVVEDSDGIHVVMGHAQYGRLFSKFQLFQGSKEVLTVGLHVEDVEVGSTASASVFRSVWRRWILTIFMLIKVINLSAKLLQTTLLPARAE